MPSRLIVVDVASEASLLSLLELVNGMPSRLTKAVAPEVLRLIFLELVNDMSSRPFVVVAVARLNALNCLCLSSGTACRHGS